VSMPDIHAFEKERKGASGTKYPYDLKQALVKTMSYSTLRALATEKERVSTQIQWIKRWGPKHLGRRVSISHVS
jgi:hypothetical protein